MYPKIFQDSLDSWYKRNDQTQSCRSEGLQLCRHGIDVITYLFGKDLNEGTKLCQLDADDDIKDFPTKDDIPAEHPEDQANISSPRLREDKPVTIISCLISTVLSRSEQKLSN